MKNELSYSLNFVAKTANLALGIHLIKVNFLILLSMCGFYLIKQIY